MRIEFLGIRRGIFQRGQFTAQGFDLLLHLRIGLLLLGVLGGYLGQAFVQFAGLRGHLRQALVQVRGLAGDAHLLFALVLQLVFQLFDLQLQRFAVAGDVSLAGDHLAGNILQAPRRFFTDSRKAFLGCHQLLLHQRNLLEAPPGKACEGKEQGADQCPQRAGTRRLDLHHWWRARVHGGAGALREIIIEDVCTQARYIVEVIVGIVTHGH
ncbi:hypothetical protein D9M71_553960 [compost metagenome]